ncbi:hypothetical protein BD310DRAFT_977281 [Dichomitus squalens]|uniref:Uncharacterized protein n=1 Tax=Dichomitus squalens TaxID=114155 RepID=A0A4V2K848_9APHY|nr:hypothetical protein BD310DRAFT_977281 [Dichomitus squalens]
MTQAAVKMVKSEAAAVRAPHEGVGVSRQLGTLSLDLGREKDVLLVSSSTFCGHSAFSRTLQPDLRLLLSSRRGSLSEHRHVKKEQEFRTSVTRRARVLLKDIKKGDETLMDNHTGVGNPGSEAIAIVGVLNKLHQAYVSRTSLKAQDLKLVPIATNSCVTPLPTYKRSAPKGSFS